MTNRCGFSVTVLLAALAMTCALTPLALAEPPGTDKPDAARAEAELVKALKGADAVLTAAIARVRPLSQTNSIPPSIHGKVTLKDIKALSGALPRATTFSYSYREGMTPNLDLMATGPVLVAVKRESVVVIVPATDATLALAKKALGLEK